MSRRCLLLLALLLGVSALAEGGRSLLGDPDRALLEGRGEELREVCLSLEGRATDPDHPAALVALKRLARTVEEAERRLGDDRGDRRVRGELAYLQGRYREARRELLAALVDRAPSDRERLLLARCYLELGEPGEGLALLAAVARGEGELAPIARREIRLWRLGGEP